MASKLVSYVQTVQLKLKIEEATLPHHDEPTPLYLYDEVTAAIGRDRKNVDDAIDCLEQRLQFRSTATKQKALKLIKHMSQKGSAELQRGLVRLSGQIKELQSYRCAPDAFKGDVPWKRVQEYAREALEAIHSVKGDGGRNGVGWSAHGISSISSTGGKKMEGFGSGAGPGGINGGGVSRGGSMSSGRRYEGFGSDGVGSSSSMLEHEQGDVRGLPFGTKLAMGLSELKSAALAGAAGLGDFAGAYTGKGGSGSPDGSGYRSTYSPPTRPQIDVDAFEGHGYASHSTRNTMTPMSDASNASKHSQASGGGSARTPTSQAPEERLVQQFVTKSQGVRVAPTVDECTKFLTTCASHGSIPLAKAFEKTLLHGSWKEVLRALCVLDVAATGGGISGTAVISSMVAYFKEHPDSLHRASESAQDRVKSKAVSVLGRMGVASRSGVQSTSILESVEPSSSGGGRMPGGSPGAGIDLLSMDDLGGAEGAGGAASGEVSGLYGVANKAADVSEAGLPSLLETLAVDDMAFVAESPHDKEVELRPNSPVAGLISGTGASIQSKASDPFGDWLGAEETSPVPASPTDVLNISSQPTTKDPFAAMDMGTGLSDSPSLSTVVPSTTLPSNGSTSAASKPPMLDDFFTSIPTSGAIGTMAAPTTAANTTGPPGPGPASPNGAGRGTPTDVLGAWHATTSGFTSSQREEAAFDFGDLSQL